MQLIPENILKTKIMDWNAAYFGVSIAGWMETAGQGIAQIIKRRYPRKKTLGIFCGPGNNGGDGLAAARYLSPKYRVLVLLFGDPKKINTPEARLNWRRLQKAKIPATVIAAAARIKNLKPDFDLVVDCLLGTGSAGKLRQPIAAAVKLYNRLRATKISVDVPTRGIKKTDLNISLQFAKTKNAKVVSLRPQEKFIQSIGPGEVKALRLPASDSHKGQNGRLLIAAGSQKYHGALVYVLKTAAKIVDLIYVYSPQNSKLLQSLKSKSAGFITLDNFKEAIKLADCALVGPGLGKSEATRNLVIKILRAKKRAVLDAGALTSLSRADLKLLNQNHILTPHKQEFVKTFALAPTAANAQKITARFGCTVVLKGKVDVVSSGAWGVKYNYTGNEGMTKGGTGDVLAGLTAALFCTNNAYLAAAAAVFINGAAGDQLYKKVGPFYSAEDLQRQIPLTLHRLVRN